MGVCRKNKCLDKSEYIHLFIQKNDNSNSPSPRQQPDSP